MRHVLLPHQRRAFRYARGRKRIALFMEQRLGKTPVAIRWATQMKSRRVLLVAPLSTLLGKLNWQGELQREGISPIMLPSVPKEQRLAVIRPSRLRHGMLSRRWADGWFAVNYEALRTQPELLDVPWDTIILDESTRIRSPKAQITKTLLASVDHINHRAILSGLPNPEDAMDFFCQFKFRDGHFMGFDNYWSFRHKHFHTIYTEWDWRPKAGTREKIKQYVQAHAFILTRKQAKVGSEKVRGMRTVELNAKQRALMTEAKKQFAIGEVETKWATVRETWLQRIAGGFHPTTLDIINDAKIRLAEDLIMEEFRKQPMVMWFRFNEELHAVYRWLTSRNKKLTVEYVTGDTKPKDRPKVQERFQDGHTQVLLMQVKLGRFGWNLARSNVSCYYSNTYEFEDRAQSEDRIIHLKKQEPVLLLDLVTLHTPDEDVVEALTQKRLDARSFSRAMAKAVVQYVTP